MITKCIRVSKQYWSDLKWAFIDFGWKFQSHPVTEEIVNFSYSIGVVTYVNRYKIHFLPLIKRLVSIFPDTQIVIAINGYYDEDVQKQYLDKITTLLSSYKNVNFITYDKGQSLSKLWNQLIIHSKADKTFIFNDDIKIASSFRNRIEQSGILKGKCGLINSSWSHFLISKEIIKMTGWFDERFPGVGYEDHDYEIRLKMGGVEIPIFEIGGIKNISFLTKDFSYGKGIEVYARKYTGINSEFYEKKWDISDEKKRQYVYCRIIQGYAKLKEGMETPNFYLEMQLN